MPASERLAAIVMAGGRGTRLRSSTPKLLVELAGRPMVEWVLEAVRGLGPRPLVVVVPPGVRVPFAGVEVAVQEQPLGTADAVASARPALRDFEGDVVVLAADTPLVRTATLDRLVRCHRSRRAAVTVLSFVSPEPLPYGRIVRGPRGELAAIVEEGDATAEQREIRELNSSIYVFDAARLWQGIAGLDAANAKRELQLTSSIRGIVAAGGAGAVCEAPDPTEAVGVNTPEELALAREALLRRSDPGS